MTEDSDHNTPDRPPEDHSYWEESLDEAVVEDDMEAFGKMAGELMYWDPESTVEELLENAEGFSDEFFTAWATSIRQNHELIKLEPKVLSAISSTICHHIQEEQRWKLLHKMVLLVEGFAGLGTWVCLEYLYTSRDASQAMQEVSETLLRSMHPKGQEENWAETFVDLWEQAVAENDKRQTWEKQVEKSGYLGHFERILSLLYRKRDKLWTPSIEVLDKLVRAFTFHANYLQMSRENIKNLQGLTAAMLDALHFHKDTLGADVTRELAKRKAWGLVNAISLRNGEEFIENCLDPTQLRSFRAHYA